MDVLSDVLRVMRTGRPRSAMETWHAPWAVQFPPVPGAVGFRVVVRGSCVLLPFEAEPIQLGQGEVVLLSHGGGHMLADSTASAWGYDNAGQDGAGPVTVTLCGAYELAPTSTHPLLRELPEVVRLTGGRPDLKATVDLLTSELNRPGLGTDGAVPALLDMLLLYSLREWLEITGPESGPNWATALRDPAVAVALGAIHRDPAHPWTVASLAVQAGLSRAQFAKRFTELTGQPPLRYLTWWRMTTAARLLRTSEAPLRSVADEVGYHSEFAFATAFKRHYGTAPGRYRRLTR